jgi:hypothetical protein
MLDKETKDFLLDGTVIPAQPLALTADRKFDKKRQKLLNRYYMASGAGGVAVGVHTTQFEIRNDDIGLFEPVLKLVAEVVEKESLNRPFVKVAGIVGPADQAVHEAEIAASYGYDLGLLSMGGLDHLSKLELIKRSEKVADKIPLFGFYLQPAAGGRLLSFDFWKDFVQIPAVHAIKIAPFNRYQTLDVVRAVCRSSRYKEIALYTGNDDNIIPDLLTTYRFDVNGEYREKSIVGGLLGQWAVWTRKAVELLKKIKEIRKTNETEVAEFLARGVELTDANAAIFDAMHNFNGTIPGVHEILRRQGLFEGTWCLNPDEKLSPGQMDEIDRVYSAYPYLHDDDFVRQFLHQSRS